MSTIIIVGIVVIASCAFGIYAAMNVEQKPKNKSTTHKHA